MSVSNDLSVGGVLTAPNINLTGLTTLVIGSALMGSRSGGYTTQAIFNHKDMTGLTQYALLQNNEGLTFLNSATNDIRFRHQNNERMSLHQDGTYTVLDLSSPSSGQCKIRMRHSNGDYWDCEAPTSEIRWRYNGNVRMSVGNTSFKVHYANANDNLVNSGGSLQLTNPSSGYLGGHMGKYLMFKGNFYDGGSYQTIFMPMWGGNNNTSGMVLYDVIKNDFRVAIRQSNLHHYNFYVNGSSSGATSWGNASDDRIKFNEEDINGLVVIRQLYPKKYDKIIQFGDDKTDISYNDSSYNNWMPPSDSSFNENPNKYDHIKEVGIIAQDLLETDISFVVVDKENPQCAFTTKSVDYNSIFTYSIQAIKELDVIVQGLRDKINNLEAENEILEARVHELEKL